MLIFPLVVSLMKVYQCVCVCVCVCVLTQVVCTCVFWHSSYIFKKMIGYYSKLVVLLFPALFYLHKWAIIQNLQWNHTQTLSIHLYTRSFLTTHDSLTNTIQISISLHLYHSQTK